MTPNLSQSNYFKLIRIIFVKECDRHTHDVFIITGYIFRFANFDCREIVISRIFIFRIPFIKDEIFMPLFIIKVGKPSYSLDFDELFTSVIHSTTSSI